MSYLFTRFWFDRSIAVTLIAASACLPFNSSSPNPQSATLAGLKLRTQLTSVLVTVTPTVLEAYENQSEPIGSNEGLNRPVGHAVVRLRMENLTLEPLKLHVQVSIWDAAQQRELMTRDLEEITLGGRQILEPGFHLSNRDGFWGIQQVKAIVTYQIDQATDTVESPLTDVVVNP